jgi:hypothetical protein
MDKEQKRIWFRELSKRCFDHAESYSAINPSGGNYEKWLYWWNHYVKVSDFLLGL